ncbi:MAG: hypothetical protein RMM53_03265 [Bacteroidia bacterium]|nr:hypothetical protein [Bacteroidia bacterium]
MTVVASDMILAPPVNVTNAHRLMKPAVLDMVLAPPVNKSG